MVRHSTPAANYSRVPSPMPHPDDLIGRDLVAARAENLPSYRSWDVYADDETPGVVLLASPRPASA
jgi:hypothetical protein